MNMKLKTFFAFIITVLAAMIQLSCTPSENISVSQPETIVVQQFTDSGTNTSTVIRTEVSNSTTATAAITTENPNAFKLSDIPAFTDSPYTVVNGNIPFFTSSDLTETSYEYYSELDSLGRCGVTMACVGQDIMPTEKRGKIGAVKPTGWHLDKYDFIDGKYLYNRCHLLGYQLTGENANVCNLITGTRYMNTQGMLPFENSIADFVHTTGQHVLYRVTPVFEGSELLARGVLMEAYSVEDEGKAICFNVFCYNAYPGIGIDYSNGDNWLIEKNDQQTQDITKTVTETYTETVPETTAEYTVLACDYVLNMNTHKIHCPDCPSVPTILEKNRLYYSGSLDELLEQGYSPCGRCRPDLAEETT